MRRATVDTLENGALSRQHANRVSRTEKAWDWKEANMKGPALVGLVVVAVIAFAEGWFLHQAGPVSQHPQTAMTFKVVDVIDANNSCKQLNSTGGFAKVP